MNEIKLLREFKAFKPTQASNKTNEIFILVKKGVPLYKTVMPSNSNTSKLFILRK